MNIGRHERGGQVSLAIGESTLLTTMRSPLWASPAAAAADTHNKSENVGTKESESPRVWMKNRSCARGWTAGSAACLSPA